jgi:heme/copper-type cytochrome/quinol oxidase subunit 3
MRKQLDRRVVGDLSQLPDWAMGPRNVVWWGNLGFMLIEGTAFLLAIATYLYLQSQSPAWPPAGDRLPDLLWATIFTIGLLGSELPNLWVSRKAVAKDAAGVRLGTLAVAILGVVLIAIRGIELAHLNVRWDHDAYGSVVWMLVVLHTSHVVTDLGDTVVQSAWLYSHEIGDDQFSDVQDNSEYWSFVVLAWLPIYGLIYWVPRWM